MVKIRVKWIQESPEIANALAGLFQSGGQLTRWLFESNPRMWLLLKNKPIESWLLNFLSEFILTLIKFVSYVRRTKSIWQTNPRSTLISSWMTLLKSSVFWTTRTNFVEGGSINEWAEYTLHILLGLMRTKANGFIWCMTWFTGSWVSTKNK